MSGEPLILVLDSGTSSTRAFLYDTAGRIHGQASRPITQHYPAPGLVEHDADEIWTQSRACLAEVIAAAGGASRIAALGLTNQRETLVAWDRRTGRPLARAIVWQDRRTADTCDALRGHEPEIERRTGLRLDPYFSATKMAWLLEHGEAVRSAGDALAFGTIDSWLLFNLTGDHLSDVSNASRTLLLDLDGTAFAEDLCDLFAVPRAALPRIVPTAGPLGTLKPALFGGAIPLTASIGDQQSATVGQGCLSPGDTKLTLGTGAFVLTNLGPGRPAPAAGLLGTVLHQVAGHPRHHALEGSVFVAGSLVKWLRDNLGLVASAAETAELAASVPDNGGVTLLPALSGLGAPYWKPDATAAITGLTFAATRAHLARAALESVSHQMADLAAAFAAADAPWTRLRLDGGMSANDWLAQDLADMCRLPVHRPADVETTARGAAIMAAVGAGLYPDLEQAAAAMTPATHRFEPRDLASQRASRLGAWRALVERA
ncbi:FGGY family carbohydrate kinase [Sphingomonas glaciei]|uniref:ATP:glycerol 3-phosphotransferase n=1 Tax=Sphingomonas glaciei TaxID=2938948 RepID=A0ABY5MV17_9SPHN|nr:FGGY family carbohydrate kinase [Sphingomonas glaciei]UUR07631.1 FGGY family carbohydrate kinase [Sphingomonas glaciei]